MFRSNLFRSRLVRSTSLLMLAAVLVGFWASDFPGTEGSNTWEHRPNDPRYTEDWHLYSFIPAGHQGQLSDQERAMGSGLHVDRAWQIHLGDPETTIAVLDSGIFWNYKDLINQIKINTKELPLPENSNVYDKNQDGRVNIQDYLEDSRVKDHNENGVIDAGDLIAIFSNGTDEDQNGFVDDIAGWDFHEHDNDPFDRVRYKHGTSQAVDSLAETNNGIKAAGICGKCTLLPIRLNDSFIVDGNAFAAGVRYATDQGVSMVQQALGALNWSHETVAAVEYAYDNGVIIIGSAADENSYHHNYPSTIDPIVYPNSIRPNSREVSQATSFLNFNNCSNYGARVDVSVPGVSCSSEATANLSGVTALSLSYAKKLGRDLTPAEMTSLIRTTTMDINLGYADSDSFRHSTYSGWDLISGYGRVNAFNILDRIRDNKIPPSVRILSPKWFAVERWQDDLRIEVEIEASARGQNETKPLVAKIYLAKGAETSGTEPKLIATKMLADPDQKIRIEITKSDLESLTPNTRQVEHNKDAYTIIVKVALDDIHSEARRTFFSFDDTDLLESFPKKLKGSGESSGIFADLDQDGQDEFIVADGSGYIYAYSNNKPQGILDGFPILGALSSYAHDSSILGAAITAPLAVADLDSDGRLDIVAVTLENHVIAINHQGQKIEGFPIRIPDPDYSTVNKKQRLSQGIMAKPQIISIENNEENQIVIPAMDGQLHVFNADGSERDGFPVALEVDGLRAKSLSAPAIYDFNQDGILDFALGSNHRELNAGSIFAIDGRGNNTPQDIEQNAYLPGFPAKIPVIRADLLPTVGFGVPTAPLVTDIDQDGKVEIIVYPAAGKIYALSSEGKLKKLFSSRVSEGTNTNDTHMVAGLGQPILADLDGDSIDEIVALGFGRRGLTNMLLGGKRFDYDHMLGIWSTKTGKLLKNYPQKMDEMMIFNYPYSSDVLGDDLPEILVGSSGYYVRGFNAGGEIEELRHFTGGWMLGSISSGDFDGDGSKEIGVSTREGYVFIWKTPKKFVQ